MDHLGDEAEPAALLDEVDLQTARLLDEVDLQTARLLDTVRTLDDPAVRAPSRLPGWSRGHVLTHPGSEPPPPLSPAIPTGGSVPYTGEVTPGGPSDVRQLPDVVIRKASVSTQDNNAYLITCRATGEQLLIDAADDPARVLALVAEGGPGLSRVVTTHQHWDHHRALAEVSSATGARTAAGREDAGALPVAAEELLDDGDIVTVGALRLAVRHLRGHTPGSVALILRSSDGSVHAFTGDSLFPGGVGNTRGDADNFASLIDDVEQRIFAELPDGTWVYPGHGKDTTLGAERPHLGEWRTRGW